MDLPLNPLRRLPLDLPGFGGPRALDARAFLLAVAFAVVSLGLNTAANRFPSGYHPDEPSKARQVLAGEYNFHHPMLMLTATRGIMALTGTPAETEAVTITGRWASALFTAGAVFFLTLLAALLGGPVAAAAAGALLVTNHQLFELAHYFKEDPAVLFGMSAFFLAAVAYDRAPNRGRAAALGAALGLAISGKYIGVVLLPVAAFLFWTHRRTLRPAPAAALALGGLAAVLLVANLPVLLHPAQFLDGFRRELDFVVSGHKGLTRSVPHGVYGAVFRESTNGAVWLALIAYALLLILRARHRAVSRGEWIVALFPLAFALLLSFSPKTHHRYFLPATAVLLTLAALGLAALPHLRWRGRPLFRFAPAGVLTAGLLALLLAVQAPRFLAYFEGFRRDGRTALAAYLRAEVPPGTVIVQDKRVNLRALGVPYDIRGKLFAADVGTIDELRAQGIRYVAVSDGDFGRFFLANHQPTKEGAADYQRRRTFYERLFAEGDRVFACEAGTLQYLQPHLQLYRLPPTR